MNNFPAGRAVAKDPMTTGDRERAMRSSTISVCLLTFNHVNLVESTIESILAQTIANYEVIVSDDCSTDGTWEKILQMAEGDRRIRPIRTPRNMGMPGNANFAVANSRRDYIALLHHDDLYRSDLLEQWVGVAIDYPDVAFVFNPYDESSEVNVFGKRIGTCRIDGQWFLSKILFPRWGSAVRGTAFVRRSAWNSIGGMREQFGLLADVDMWMRLSARWAVGYVADPVIQVRQDRPHYYPGEYKAGSWSWERQRFLLMIHGTNRQEVFAAHTLSNWIRMQWFRVRLSVDTLKWLGYAIVKRKPTIIETSELSATEYDMWWLRVIRSTLHALYARKRH